MKTKEVITRMPLPSGVFPAVWTGRKLRPASRDEWAREMGWEPTNEDWSKYVRETSAAWTERVVGKLGK